MNEPTRTLFEEDTAAHKVAASLGFQLVRRYRAIDVDETELPAEFKSSKPKPDFAKISRALDEGREVPGARWRSMEFILRPQGVSDESR